MDNVELLSQADALVINGGYSAVSEAFVLGKPVFVVPVSGHAEQFVNASLVRNLELGFVADEATVLDQLLTMYERDEWVGINHPAGRSKLMGRVRLARQSGFFEKERFWRRNSSRFRIWHQRLSAAAE